jgi:hypothetical protein
MIVGGTVTKGPGRGIGQLERIRQGEHENCSSRMRRKGSDK